MKNFSIILIVIFGFLLMPSSAFACGNSRGSKSEKQSCKKETSSKSDNDSCCNNDSHSKTKNNNGCGGKCGHSKCTCPSVITGFTLSHELVLKKNNFDFSFEKQKYSNAETFISSGFSSLWLIPKIR